MLTSLMSWTFLERHDFYNTVAKETSSIQSVKSFYVCFIQTADETGNWIGNHPLSNSFRFQLRDDHFEKGTKKIFRIEILSNELSYLILTTFSISITNGKTSSSYWTKNENNFKMKNILTKNVLGNDKIVHCTRRSGEQQQKKQR